MPAPATLVFECLTEVAKSNPHWTAIQVLERTGILTVERKEDRLEDPLDTIMRIAEGMAAWRETTIRGR